MGRVITLNNAPALGDIRALGFGQTVWIQREAMMRKDWARYVEAIAAAVARGAEVRWT